MKYAEIFSNEDECKLWDSGVLRYTNPNSQWAFYVVDKFFALRFLRFCGGSKHRNLRLSQLRRESAPDNYMCTTRTCLRTQMAHSKISLQANDCPSLYACPEAGDWCPVTILDEHYYIDRLRYQSMPMNKTSFTFVHCLRFWWSIPAMVCKVTCWTGLFKQSNEEDGPISQNRSK